MKNIFCRRRLECPKFLVLVLDTLWPVELTSPTIWLLREPCQDNGNQISFSRLETAVPLCSLLFCRSPLSQVSIFGGDFHSVL